jgi:hypothetical protein
MYAHLLDMMHYLQMLYFDHYDSFNRIRTRLLTTVVYSHTKRPSGWVGGGRVNDSMNDMTHHHQDSIQDLHTILSEVHFYSIFLHTIMNVVCLSFSLA